MPRRWPQGRAWPRTQRGTSPCTVPPSRTSLARLGRGLGLARGSGEGSDDVKERAVRLKALLGETPEDLTQVAQHAPVESYVPHFTHIFSSLPLGQRAQLYPFLDEVICFLFDGDAQFALNPS